MQRKEKENIQKKDNSSDEESDEYFSEGNDDDYFVDNLKHFSNATQSRFIGSSQKDITQKASTSTNDTTERSKSFQDLHKLSSQSSGLPNLV